MKNNWKNVSDVIIPPIDSKGFKERIMVREHLESIKNHMAIAQQNENKTVLLKKDEDNEETILLQNISKQIACIKRIKTGEIVIVDNDEFILGKASYCDFTIHDNPTISRRHAKIVLKNKKYYLEDLKSSNHTFMYDREIDMPVEIIDGNEFCLSNELFQFIITRGEK